MPKVSIIMPSLNVAAYIRECLESVVNQSLKELEILCVDAGSTDGTWEILKEYAQKDERIQLIQSDKKSYGYQMNLGLRMAQGEYIGFVETDDFVLPEMYDELYICAKTWNADFVKSDFDVFTTSMDGERIYLRYSLKKYSCVEYGQIFTAEDYMQSQQSIDVYIWNGIYKRTFLEQNSIMFQETQGAAFQDCGFRYQVILNVQRGVYTDKSYYRYRRDNGSSSTYNSKCVLYNLLECRNLVKMAKERGLGRVQMGFLAKEIAIVAHRPYVELLTWGEPCEGTAEALNEFRYMIKDFMEQGVLTSKMMTQDLWLEIRMFAEQPVLYDHYANLKAETVAENIKDFLKIVASQKEIIIFGCGYVGACVYCLLKNNSIQNIKAFCDNDPNKWGNKYYECPVEPLETVLEKFPDAYFIIAAKKHVSEIRKQLSAQGIQASQMAAYGLTTFPLDCTNLIMRDFV